MTHAVRELLELGQRKRIRHAQRLRAVVEVREEEDVLAGERLLDGGLVDAAEGAGRYLALCVLVEGFLGEAAALGGGTRSGASHVDCDGGAQGVVLGECDVDFAAHAWGDAGVDDGLLEPFAVAGFLCGLVEGVDDGAVEVVASLHEAVTQIRVLVEGEVAAAEAELVLVVAVSEFGRESAGGGLGEGGLEDDLGGAAAEVEHGGGGRLVGAADLAEEVVCGDPGEDALLLAGHDLDAALCLGDDGEGVLCLEAVAHGLEGVVALFLAQLAEAGGGLDGDGGAPAVGLGDALEGEVHEDVQALGGALGIVAVGRQPRAALLLLRHLEVLMLELGRGPAVVELVGVDARAGAACVDHEGVLDERLVLGVRLGARRGLGAGCCCLAALAVALEGLARPCQPVARCNEVQHEHDEGDDAAHLEEA